MDLGEYLPVRRKTNSRFGDARTEAVPAYGWSALVTRQ